jgi:hypothetical protein
MSQRIKYRLNKFKNKLSVNSDFYAKVYLSGEEKPIPLGEINHVLNVGDQFDKERNESPFYRFTFTISPLFGNPLMNPTGPNGNENNWGSVGSSTIYEDNNSLSTLDGDIFKKDLYDNDFGGLDLIYPQVVNEKLIEKDGWFGFFDPDVTRLDLCRFYDIEPTRKKFSLNSNITKNWEFLITYPSESYDTHHIVNGGLLVVNLEEVEVGGRPMVAVGSSTRHNLSSGERVRLSDMGDTDLNGDFNVIRLGLDNGDNKQNYFVIDVDPSLVAGSLGSSFGGGRMKRLVSGNESTYYIRRFKNIMVDIDNSEIYPLAFSKNIFDDQIYQLMITEDINVSDLTDNLGRPLSELYLTIIKTNSNNQFGNIKSGLDLEFLSGNLTDTRLSNTRRIHDGSTTPFETHEPLNSSVTVNGDVFDGDVVEYNTYELKETVLCEVLHRFNTVIRETSNTSSPAKGPRREGYMYRPHNRIQIRNFSAYIEQGDENTAGIPDYAEDLGDGRIIWRDFLNIGEPTGKGDEVDYPFTNGTHYIHQNICLPTLRQDPFGLYGLYYGGSDISSGTYNPADPRGDDYTDNFTIKRSDDVC